MIITPTCNWILVEIMCQKNKWENLDLKSSIEIRNVKYCVNGQLNYLI